MIAIYQVLLALFTSRLKNSANQSNFVTGESKWFVGSTIRATHFLVCCIEVDEDTALRYSNIENVTNKLQVSCCQRILIVLPYSALFGVRLLASYA